MREALPKSDQKQALDLLQDAMPDARILADCCLDLGRHLRTTQLLALRPNTV
jgi:hypothetical protein